MTVNWTSVIPFARSKLSASRQSLASVYSLRRDLLNSVLGGSIESIPCKKAEENIVGCVSVCEAIEATKGPEGGQGGR